MTIPTSTSPGLLRLLTPQHLFDLIDMLNSKSQSQSQLDNAPNSKSSVQKRPHHHHHHRTFRPTPHRNLQEPAHPISRPLPPPAHQNSQQLRLRPNTNTTAQHHHSSHRVTKRNPLLTHTRHFHQQALRDDFLLRAWAVEIRRWQASYPRIES
ncbi:hypothetical protein BU24DRAFT_21504 [Aaosphaeria arxii CBS 175.79]|uniref:Uncharacterized protein n=1 Tax=Aaosphaeria arxii CBS 175.79 TaxID=1450172 RepID=A0A6A5Y844_9PLEO|nr:uncharacterized protein BU24DRAFT_21504 [Aaosphaeria arxii CBS 175.79]KAF2021489.1 hypothetical protein BU24DRAFT_21504 [Aaosphaeria arxii CBS 175.79]